MEIRQSRAVEIGAERDEAMSTRLRFDIDIRVATLIHATLSTTVYLSLRNFWQLLRVV